MNNFDSKFEKITEENKVLNQNLGQMQSLLFSFKNELQELKSNKNNKEESLESSYVLNTQVGRSNSKSRVNSTKSSTPLNLKKNGFSNNDNIPITTPHNNNPPTSFISNRNMSIWYKNKNNCSLMTNKRKSNLNETEMSSKFI